MLRRARRVYCTAATRPVVYSREHAAALSLATHQLALQLSVESARLLSVPTRTGVQALGPHGLLVFVRRTERVLDALRKSREALDTALDTVEDPS